jgi:hypothetical protein
VHGKRVRLGKEGGHNMRGVLCGHDYGVLGKKFPCPICEYEYDPGFGYHLRPCPRCGHDPEDWPIRTVISDLSFTLKTSQGKIRKALAKEMGVEPETLKRWQYKGVKKNVEEVIDRFSRAVRAFIKREENKDKIEKKIEEYEKWYKKVFNGG